MRFIVERFILNILLQWIEIRYKQRDQESQTNFQKYLQQLCCTALDSIYYKIMFVSRLFRFKKRFILINLLQSLSFTRENKKTLKNSIMSAFLKVFTIQYPTSIRAIFLLLIGYVYVPPLSRSSYFSILASASATTWARLV